jgi:hypothetical protein
VQVTRHVWDAAAGKSVPSSEVLEVPIKKGWKAGTKITFAGKGDQEPGRPADDLVFVVSEKPHPRFTRSGNDLVRVRVRVRAGRGRVRCGVQDCATLLLAVAEDAPLLTQCRRVVPQRARCCRRRRSR